MKSMRNILLLIISITFISNFTFAQWVQTNGPFGGNIQCFGVSGTNLYAGTSNGLFLSSNYGNTWSEISNGLTNRNIQAIVSDGATTYVGTQDGIFISNNNGTSWKEISNGLTGKSIQAFLIYDTLVFAGGSSGTIYNFKRHENTWKSVFQACSAGVCLVEHFAVVDTNIFVGTQGAAVFRSSDKGLNWVKLGDGLRNSFITSLAASDNFVFACPMSTISRSTDLGKSWKEINSGLPDDNIQALTYMGKSLSLELKKMVFLFHRIMEIVGKQLILAC